LATLTSGHKVTGNLALPMARAGGYNAAVGDIVRMTANYTVNKITAVDQLPVGQVIVANVRRGVITTEDITVEMRGDHVDILVAGTGGVTAGSLVEIAADGRAINSAAMATTPAGAMRYYVYGIALTGATVGLNVDVMPL
jgi:hypothetical protein